MEEQVNVLQGNYGGTSESMARAMCDVIEAVLKLRSLALHDAKYYVFSMQVF